MKKWIVLFSLLLSSASFSFWDPIHNTLEQHNVHVKISGGATYFVLPKFHGDDTYLSYVYPFIDISVNDRFFFSPYKGLGANIIKTDNFKSGVAARYRFDQSGSRNKVNGNLNHISPFVEGDVFAEYTDKHMVYRADYYSILDKNYGDRLNFAAYYRGSLNDHCFYSIGPSFTYSFEHYMQTFFGISSSQSEKTGLATYHPSGAINELSLTMSGQYYFSKKWYVGGMGIFTKMLRPANKSVIIQSSLQMFYAMNFGYVFW